MSEDRTQQRTGISRIYSNIAVFLRGVNVNGESAPALVEAQNFVNNLIKEIDEQEKKQKPSTSGTSSRAKKDSGGVASRKVSNTKRKSSKRKSS